MRLFALPGGQGKAIFKTDLLIKNTCHFESKSVHFSPGVTSLQIPIKKMPGIFGNSYKMLRVTPAEK
ncbi:hypothetical protein L0Z72_16405 [candidate division KSB1 bacterium]|nr:hypothetical protein [candidate division KSB1 bacterium]